MPTSWQVRRLGELGALKNGVNFSRDEKGGQSDNSLRLINVKDIFGCGRYIDLAVLDRVSLKTSKSLASSTVKKGDLFFVRSSVKRDGVGLVSMAPISDANTVHCGFVIRYRLTAPDVDPLFLTYTLRSPLFRKAVINLSSGAAITNISQSALASLEIPIPARPVQRKITAILSAYDDLIENNAHRIKILEEMARVIFREWFINFRFPGHENCRKVESELGTIPAGWEVKSIGEVIETVGGSTPSTKNPEFWEDGDITWFTPSDLTSAGAMFISNSAKKINKFGLQNSSARLFPPYSVMMTSRATIGVISINTREACTNQGFITCIPNDRLSVIHIYFWIEENRQKIIGIASGATYKEINRTEFRELQITISDPKTEEQFVEVINPIAKQIENLLKKNINLRRTRDLLLPRLISGELDVEELDIAIPEVEETEVVVATP